MNFPDRFSKNASLKITKIYSVGPELFHTERERERGGGERGRERERQTDLKELIVAFCNFAKAPKKRTQFQSL